jgi:hypothetical protein
VATALATLALLHLVGTRWHAADLALNIIAGMLLLAGLLLFSASRGERKGHSPDAARPQGDRDQP